VSHPRRLVMWVGQYQEVVTERRAVMGLRVQPGGSQRQMIVEGPLAYHRVCWMMLSSVCVRATVGVAARCQSWCDVVEGDPCAQHQMLSCGRVCGRMGFGRGWCSDPGYCPETSGSWSWRRPRQGSRSRHRRRALLVGCSMIAG
jgi:hypothetical protein